VICTVQSTVQYCGMYGMGDMHCTYSLQYITVAFTVWVIQ